MEKEGNTSLKKKNKTLRDLEIGKWEKEMVREEKKMRQHDVRVAKEELQK